MPKLRVVIVEISDYSFDRQLGKETEAWRMSFYRRFYGISEKRSFPGALWQPLDSCLLAMYGPGSARQTLASIPSGGPLKNFHKDGWDGLVGQIDPAAVERKIMTDADKADSLPFNHRIERKTIKALERLIVMARDRKVEVVLVTLPVHELHSRYMGKQRWKIMQRIVESLCRQNHLRYFDHLSTPLLPSDDFVDTVHLNEQGATAASRLIARDIAGKS